MDLRTKLAAAAIAALVLAGCSATGTATSLLRENAPIGSIKVHNQTTGRITSVQIAECGAFNPGPNRLTAGITIAPGGSFTWRVSEGCWDLVVSYTKQGADQEAKGQLDVPGNGSADYTLLD